jgi:hypothetical protein
VQAQVQRSTSEMFYRGIRDGGMCGIMGSIVELAGRRHSSVDGGTKAGTVLPGLW